MWRIECISIFFDIPKKADVVLCTCSMWLRIFVLGLPWYFLPTERLKSQIVLVKLSWFLWFKAAILVVKYSFSRFMGWNLIYEFILQKLRETENQVMFWKKAIFGKHSKITKIELLSLEICGRASYRQFFIITLAETEPRNYMLRYCM